VLLATFIKGIPVGFFVFGPVDGGIAGVLGGAAVAGGFIGMAVARRIKPDQLRAVILVIGVGLTGVYFWKAYGNG
jgi:uncharacterized membrane protein YfcA